MDFQNLYILSGQIRSGKSTGLLNWANINENVKGVIQYNENGKRILYDIGSKLKRNLEFDKTAGIEKQIRVGNYMFNQDSFIWAKERLLFAFSQNPKWIIIDEFGKLEFQNQGLEPVVSKIINSTQKQSKINLIIVIRDSLKSDFIERYKLKNHNYKDFNLNS